MAAESTGQPSCGCKGIRSCLMCERGGLERFAQFQQKKYHFIYHPASGLAVGDDSSSLSGWTFPFPGVFLSDNFVNEEEETELVSLMDSNEWKPSQSGRKKQDYGPKVNFKKHKLKVGSFSGLPCFSHLLINRMIQHPMLKSFLPVEQCNLDYRPERGSSIDPHFDDWWLWGERLVSVNLLSETTLSMSFDSENFIPLHCNEMVCNAPSYDPVTGNSESIFNFHGDNIPVHWIDNCSMKRTSDTGQRPVPYKDVEVAINLPRRSLIALYGDARYKWKHGIYREDIKSRRICCTFRELSEEFSHGGNQEALGKELVDIALRFQGVPV
ncbi:alpha-ketoglutarate-dependent dioxygenase alkB homolog 4 [Carcharodon carcharias]|uniref:alpha-ketoglutarate-dependent dioxygenase alkB homolog 4 n=1 Tax=Carcharodon carcharias TaxID=13397 RepID=UPI001B7EC64E|nr:alpha-ketoglutarate-dependent dioxygenase alkB homolog 4 [Carcharodon carcharias]